MTPNRGFDYSERIGRGGAGRSVLDYLSRRYTHSTAGEWSARIEEGRVLLEGAPARPDAILREGRVLTWRRPPWKEPAAPLTFGLLYEDADLLAVSKPSGLPTMPGGNFLENTLYSLVRQGFPEAAPAHRLGRGTSGLVLFARTPESRSRLAEAFRSRRVSKSYRALVNGDPGEDGFVVEVPIGPVPHPLLGWVHAADAAGRRSRSDVRVLERRGGVSLVRVWIKTGRPHQVRIHLAAAGHPLAGDPLYAEGGGFAEPVTALPGDTGYRLHAERVRLEHPVAPRPVDITCPPPGDLLTREEAGPRMEP